MSKNKSKKPAPITLTVLVKNEVERLKSLLTSARPFVEEILVGDTGSTDGTQEVAISHADRLLGIPWGDDFSAARNELLARAQRPWILVLDADERLSVDAWTELAQSVGSAPHGCRFQCRNYVSKPNLIGFRPLSSTSEEAGSGAIGYVEHSLIRLFPNRPEIRFSGVVHECVGPSLVRANLPVVDVPWIIHHDGKMRGAEQLRTKERGYLLLSRKKTFAEPDNPAAWVEQGVSAYILQEWEEAADCMRRAISLKSRDPRAPLYLIQSERRLERYESALREASIAAAEWPSNPDVAVLLGELLMRLNHMVRAEGVLGRVLAEHPTHYGAERATAELLLRTHEYSKAKVRLVNLLQKTKSRDRFTVEALSALEGMEAEIRSLMSDCRPEARLRLDEKLSEWGPWES